MLNDSIHRSLLAASVLAVTGAFAAADELLVGSPTTAILTCRPYAADLQLVGACGGAAASIAIDGSRAWIGDESGIVYVRDLATGAISFAFNAPLPALGRAMHGGDLLCAGGSSVVRIDTSSGAVLAIHTLFLPVSSLAVKGDQVFVGSPWGAAMKGHAITGSFQFFGACGGPVNSIAVDESHR